MSISKTCNFKDIAPFNFKWVPSSVKYLGIRLHSNEEEIILLNLELLLQKITTNLAKLGILKLSL